MPYARDPETLARPWAIPGTPGLEHRIGGLEKADVTGSISYDPENHDLMTRLRAAKVAGIANDIPLLAGRRPRRRRHARAGLGLDVRPDRRRGEARAPGRAHVAQAHLHYLNPFPLNTGEVLRSYDKILIPEMNLGQLLKLVRAEFLVDAIGYNRVRGTPFKATELAEAITRWWTREAEEEDPDQRGLLLKERPFSYRPAGTARSRSSGRAAARRRLAGKIAEKFLEVAPTEDEQGQQLLMAKATGNFKRGNEAEAMSDGNGNPLQLTAKDFKSDQEVRWCPGCGDYAILAAVQSFMPELGLKRENIVFVSGIGCAARFPYYMQTYGMHSIHGRAPAIATGLSVSRPDLSVWVVTGDGDSMSIGGNHLIHALRRNVNLKLLIFNNEIYGLTKGQYSPTSKAGTVTKSTPMGSIDYPFNPLSLAIGAEASFVARAIDTDKKELTEVLRAAAHHKGSAFVEIYQNCNIYNDGAFDFVREEKENRLYLRHGEPIVWGDKGVRLLRTGRRRSWRRPSRACWCTTRTRRSRRTRSRSRG